MAIDRVTTYGLFTQTINNVFKGDSNLATLQNQISSGFKAQNFAGIASLTAQ